MIISYIPLSFRNGRSNIGSLMSYHKVTEPYHAAFQCKDSLPARASNIDRNRVNLWKDIQAIIKRYNCDNELVMYVGTIYIASSMDIFIKIYILRFHGSYYLNTTSNAIKYILRYLFESLTQLSTMIFLLCICSVMLTL